MPATHLQACNPIDTNALILQIIETIPDFKALENFEEIQHAWWAFATDSVPYWRVREPLNGKVLGIDELGQLLIQSDDGRIVKRHQTFE